MGSIPILQVRQLFLQVRQGKMLVTFIFGIGKCVTILLPIFFYHNSAESLPSRQGFGRVITPSGLRLSFHVTPSAYIQDIPLILILG